MEVCMTLLIVDNEKCKKDGICAADCPMAIIKIEKKRSRDCSGW